MKKIKFLALAVIASLALVSCGPSADFIINDMKAAVENNDKEAFNKAMEVAEEKAEADSTFFTEEQLTEIALMSLGMALK